MERTKSNSYGPFFLVTSLVGLCLLAAMVFTIPPSETHLSWQGPIVGSLFVLICLSGIVAGISPSTCSGLIKSATRDGRQTALTSSKQSEVKESKGHHPDCGRFSTHTFQFRGRTYCAGCTGLIVGAVASIFGTIGYLTLRPQFEGIGGMLFWLGFLGVALGLLQHNLPIVERSYTHLLLNVVFVFGAFLLLVGMMEMGSSLIIEAYFLVLALYWILTRVMLSQEEHQKTCDECGRTACGFV
jgi:hypothetical protein